MNKVVLGRGSTGCSGWGGRRTGGDEGAIEPELEGTEAPIDEDLDVQPLRSVAGGG